MSAHHVRSCVLIGQGSLPICCGNLLRQRSWSIRTVHSPDASLTAWAHEAGLRHLTARAELRAALARDHVDYIFSINNPWILPPELLACARRRAINYHDSPLPRYAGLHATSWAILAGETEHAVSWHELRAQIDA